MRKISEAGVDVELAILVEARGMESDAALEIPVHRNPWRPCIPPVAVEILKRIAVARALDEPTRLVCYGVVRCIRKRAEWTITDVHARRIDVVLGARRAVLEIVAPVVLCHPRAFDERRHR